MAFKLTVHGVEILCDTAQDVAALLTAIAASADVPLEAVPTRQSQHRRVSRDLKIATSAKGSMKTAALRDAILVKLSAATKPLRKDELRINGSDPGYLLKQLVKEGVITAHGSTNSRRYTATSHS